MNHPGPRLLRIQLPLANDPVVLVLAVVVPPPPPALGDPKVRVVVDVQLEAVMLQISPVGVVGLQTLLYEPGEGLSVGRVGERRIAARRPVAGGKVVPADPVVFLVSQEQLQLEE